MKKPIYEILSNDIETVEEMIDALMIAPKGYKLHPMETNVLWQLIIFMNVCMRMRKCGLMIMNMRLSVRQKKWHYL